MKIIAPNDNNNGGGGSGDGDDLANDDKQQFREKTTRLSATAEV